jgi:two-component system chemotaxis response regulator CheY
MIVLNPMKKILILDNTKASAEEKKNILSRYDCTIFTAASGEEAIGIHRKEKVDLIIRDIDMPGMTGEGFCSNIREDYGLKKVSIIIICSGRESHIRRYEAGGANAYIRKPINPQELFQKVGELLNIPSRLNMRVLIKVEVKGKCKSEFISHSKNISASGILLETDKVLEKGDLILCNFFLGPDQVSSEGKIVRIVKKRPDLYQYGVTFIDIDLLSKSKIEKYVNRL